MSGLAADVIRNYALAFPRTVTTPSWPIAAINVSSKGSITAVNPRGYRPGPTVNTTTQAGITAFHTAMLGFAARSVAEIKRVGGGAAILWDLEGSANDPYTGDPTQIESIAPEMLNVLGPFVKVFTDAGLHIGFTLRPQIYDPATNTHIATADPSAELMRKVDYCVQRFGPLCSIFYIDTSVDGHTITPASAYEAIAAKYPGIILIPEWSDVRHFASCLCFAEPAPPLNRYGPDARTSAVYSQAASVLHVTDTTDPVKVAVSFSGGNVLMWDGFYRHQAGDLVKSIYGN